MLTTLLILIVLDLIWAFEILKEKEGLSTKYEKCEPLFENIYIERAQRDKTIMPLFYGSIFVGRRVFIGVLFVTFTSSPVAQIFTMIFLSLFDLMFLVYYWPFESKFDNVMEIINECFVYVAICHFIMFS